MGLTMGCLWVDFETKSRCNLKTKGVYNYSLDPSTEVICMSYAFGDDPVTTWKNSEPFPEAVRSWKGQIRAHNAAFERLIFWHVLEMDFALEQFYCTATQMRANCAPAALGDAARFAGTSMKKDHRGAQLIRLLSIPDAAGRFNNDPLLLQEMVAYCEQDVRAMREISQALRDLTDEELYDYHVNERINDKGIRVDKPVCDAAIKYAEEERQDIEQLVIDITKGEVLSVRSSKMKEWVMARVGPQAKKLMETHVDGEVKYSIDKMVRANLLNLAEENIEEVPNEVADVVQCADDLWASSVAKFKKLAELADPEDERVRGAFVFAGGSATGRAASFGIQLHNMARQCAKNPDEVRTAMIAGSSLTPTFGPRVSDVLKGMIRPSLIPAPGKVFVVADWSAIEGRVNPWLANSESGFKKLDDYRKGLDPYVVNAAELYHVAYGDVTKDQRQVGKVEELACFSQDTRILTDSGVKAITEITLTDKIWDGVEWVGHQGVVYKGMKETIDVFHIHVTEEHQLLAGELWCAAKMVLIDENIRYRTLATGLESLQSLVSNEKDTELVTQIWRECNALAARSPIWLRCLIFVKEHLHDVVTALKKNLRIGENHIMDTQILYQTTNIEKGYLTEYPLALGDATGRPIQHTITMEDEALQYTSLGVKVQKDEGRFLRTLSHLTVGIYRSLRWIEQMLIKGTNRVICDLLLNNRTERTNEKLPTYSRKSPCLSPVYDILNAGPRNRFTILSDEGPIVVHNCSYLGGRGAFDTFSKAFRIKLTEEEVDRAIRTWRRNNPWAFEHGNALESAYMRAMRHPGREFPACRTTYMFDGLHLWYSLPSGRILCYPFAKIEDGSVSYAKAAWKPAADAAEWPRAILWAGQAVENCWARNTKIVTKSGLKSISSITSEDEIWDGHDWVRSEGAVYNGKQEVIEWIGTRVTKNHQIYDGIQWKSVMDVDDCTLNGCLKYGRSLVPPKSSKLNLTVKQSLHALAGLPFRLTRAICAEVLTGCVGRAHWRNVPQLATPNYKSYKTQISGAYGRIAEQALYLDVPTQSIKRIVTTAVEGLLFLKNGLKTKTRGLPTLRPCAGGIIHTLTSTVLTTVKATRRAICGWYQGRKIPKIVEKRFLSRTKARMSHLLSFGEMFAQNGGATTPSRTILKLEKMATKLPSTIGKPVAVYDIVNCGPRHQYMVMTSKGPVLAHNCTQSAANDILRYALRELDDLYYDIVMHIHDEVVIEVDEDLADSTLKEMTAIMTTPPAWADGLPLEIDAHVMTRYGKG